MSLFSIELHEFCVFKELQIGVALGELLKALGDQELVDVALHRCGAFGQTLLVGRQRLVGGEEDRFRSRAVVPDNEERNRVKEGAAAPSCCAR